MNETRQLVELTVAQTNPDYLHPVGSVYRNTTTGTAVRLVRREHQEGDRQTWWVKTWQARRP